MLYFSIAAVRVTWRLQTVDCELHIGDKRQTVDYRVFLVHNNYCSISLLSTDRNSIIQANCNESQYSTVYEYHFI